MLTFGPAWDAPAYDEAERFPEIPTYARCLHCREFFVDGDQGFVMGHLGDLDPEFLVGVGEEHKLSAMHKECLLASTHGHVVGVCGCSREDWPSLAASREAWARLMAGGVRW